VLVEIDDDDLGTLLGEPARDRTADATGAPGDEGDSPDQPIHPRCSRVGDKCQPYNTCHFAS
jgi:hypothetical protein